MPYSILTGNISNTNISYISSPDQELHIGANTFIVAQTDNTSSLIANSSGIQITSSLIDIGGGLYNANATISSVIGQGGQHGLYFDCDVYTIAQMSFDRGFRGNTLVLGGGNTLLNTQTFTNASGTLTIKTPASGNSITTPLMTIPETIRSSGGFSRRGYYDGNIPAYDDSVAQTFFHPYFNTLTNTLKLLTPNSPTVPTAFYNNNNFDVYCKVSYSVAFYGAEGGGGLNENAESLVMIVKNNNPPTTDDRTNATIFGGKLEPAPQIAQTVCSGSHILRLAPGEFFNLWVWCTQAGSWVGGAPLTSGTWVYTPSLSSIQIVEY